MFLSDFAWFTHQRSVAKRGGYFQRRLCVSVCVCQFVSMFVRTLTSERLNVGRPGWRATPVGKSAHAV